MFERIRSTSSAVHDISCLFFKHNYTDDTDVTDETLCINIDLIEGIQGMRRRERERGREWYLFVLICSSN